MYLIQFTHPCILNTFDPQEISHRMFRDFHPPDQHPLFFSISNPSLIVCSKAQLLDYLVTVDIFFSTIKMQKNKFSLRITWAKWLPQLWNRREEFVSRLVTVACLDMLVFYSSFEQRACMLNLTQSRHKWTASPRQESRDAQTHPLFPSFSLALTLHFSL